MRTSARENDEFSKTLRRFRRLNVWLTLCTAYVAFCTLGKRRDSVPILEPFRLCRQSKTKEKPGNSPPCYRSGFRQPCARLPANSFYFPTFYCVFVIVAFENELKQFTFPSKRTNISRFVNIYSVAKTLRTGVLRNVSVKVFVS